MLEAGGGVRWDGPGGMQPKRRQSSGRAAFHSYSPPCMGSSIIHVIGHGRITKGLMPDHSVPNGRPIVICSGAFFQSFLLKSLSLMQICDWLQWEGRLKFLLLLVVCNNSDCLRKYRISHNSLQFVSLLTTYCDKVGHKERSWGSWERAAETVYKDLQEGPFKTEHKCIRQLLK